ncbi:MAG: glycerophosphodiester phosphodiesterase [Longimicrobiales bacterium]
MRAWLQSRPGHPYLAGSPLLIAHRGGAGLAPENTLEAFLSAVEDWGADMLELDVRTTRDGAVVVFHDAAVDRTTDGTGLLADKTLEELRDLDAGYRFLDPRGGATFRGKGVRIPTFEELLEALPHARLNVEAKDPVSAFPLVEIIRRHGAEHRVLVAAERERNRRKVRAYPGPWGASRIDVAFFLLLAGSPLGFLYSPRYDALQGPERHKGLRLLTPRFLREAHRRNIPVHVWTVDDPVAMRRLLSMGVDGIQTDRPDLLSPLMTEMVNRPTAPCLRGATPPEDADASSGLDGEG